MKKVFIILGFVALLSVCVYFFYLKDSCVMGDGLFIDVDGVTKPYGFQYCGIEKLLFDLNLR